MLHNREKKPKNTGTTSENRMTLRILRHFSLHAGVSRSKPEPSYPNPDTECPLLVSKTTHARKLVLQPKCGVGSNSVLAKGCVCVTRSMGRPVDRRTTRWRPTGDVWTPVWVPVSLETVVGGSIGPSSCLAVPFHQKCERS